ncbi:MAG: hypothetical protein ACRD4O_09050 [Bryobacteraceae bacterium]
MSRIPGVDDRGASWRIRFIFWLVKRKVGVVTPGTRIRALWPKWLERSGFLDALMAAHGAVPDSLKELAQIKAAALVGCPF